MIPGHTKFALGLFKKKFWLCNVETMLDMAQVVWESSEYIPQPIVDPAASSCAQVVNFFGSIFLGLYHTYYHIRYSLHLLPNLQYSSFISIPQVPEKKFLVLQLPAKDIPVGQIPEDISLKGLSLERQWYLFEQISSVPLKKLQTLHVHNQLFPSTSIDPSQPSNPFSLPPKPFPNQLKLNTDYVQCVIVQDITNVHAQRLPSEGSYLFFFWFLLFFCILVTLLLTLYATFKLYTIKI